MQNRFRNVHKLEPSSPEIMSVLKLKLLGNSNENKHTRRFHQLGNSIINTPSTIENAKKFKSCELYKKYQQSHCVKIKDQNNLLERVIMSQSTTKILTLHEIKKQEQAKRQRQMAKQRLRSKSSRKLFVSLSKKHSVSKDKRGYDQQLQVNQVFLADSNNKQTGQKLKLNIYKNIAKGRNN